MTNTFSESQISSRPIFATGSPRPDAEKIKRDTARLRRQLHKVYAEIELYPIDWEDYIEVDEFEDREFEIMTSTTPRDELRVTELAKLLTDARNALAHLRSK